ncbi:Ig-like domain-containing protein [Undibacterium cyanobacteriorum]|uniref:Ig-like domain-containing protein n=1 Tax=Undibacterium cyanobacteriorum TaxID=3073561 RepID=A0ABY9RJB8_9BURK|nr:PKD domain-containing protein [Undibacterium sp. 20NA77.5]WMW80929.1 Ig-like domain-containing protein [Undibacterium sp. 20NA77.5]
MLINMRSIVSAGLLSLLVACGGGGGGTTTSPAQANSAPVVSITATGLAAPAGAPAVSNLSMTFGGVAVLDGSSSRDPDGDAMNYEWTVTTKPAGSTASFDSPTQAKVNFRPDVSGSYTVQLRVSDNRGGVSTQQLVIATDNRVPLSSLSTTVQFNAVTTVMPTQVASIGANIVLDSTGVSDPDGDPVTVTFELIEKPASSVAALSFAGKAARFVGDQQGFYKVRVRGTDPKGASFESIYSFQIENRVPISNVSTTVQFSTVPVVMPTQAASVGANIVLDSTGVSDPDGDPVTVTFDLLEKPASSSAALSLVGKTARFVTDQQGVYKVRVRGTDPKGVGFETIYTFQTDNRLPTSNVLTTVQFTNIPVVMPTQVATIGSNIVLDSTGVSDPDGDPVTVSFDLSEKPSGSNAALSFAGKTARFVADLQGLYKVRVRGTDPKGGSFESIYSFQADNRTPIATVIANATTPVNAAGDTSINTSTGYNVVLDGSNSSDPEGQALTKAWVMTSRPAGSGANLSSLSGNMVNFTPDMLGTYVVTLTVTDTQGAQSTYTKRVVVNNRTPVANIGSNATPTSQASAPNILLRLGTEVTLRGSLSSDADGDSLSYLWSIDARPSGSTASLSSNMVADPKFLADKEGSYVFRLRVTDSSGAYSERTIGIDIGTHAPVAVINRDRMSVLAGSLVSASANLSYDEDGDALQFNWSIDAKPSNSTATIATPKTSNLTFTPDVPGNYAIAVTVSDGSSSSIAYLNLLVLSGMSSSVNLNFVPDRVKYSVGLDKLIVTATNPDTLRIVDPFVGSVRSVALPLPVKNLGLSPDGKLAAVLHEGIVSLIDLVNGTLIRSSSTGGAQTDVFVMNSGVVFLIGQTGGQWVDESVVALDARTGTKIVQQGGYLGMFYGTQYGILADRLNKVFLMEQGLSPADIDYFSFNPSTYQALKFGDSPYHGDYYMSVPLYLSENQNILFTSNGNYFRTDTLQYAGVLSGVTRPLSLSNSATLNETLVLQGSVSNSYPYASTLPTSYMRFSGALFLPDTEMSLPLLAGQQTYGLKIFHSASGKHVVLVQTNSNEINGSGARYAVITR